MINLLNNAIKFSNENITNFQFSTRNKYQSYSVGIYCSTLELAQSFSTLIESKNYTGSLSVYRTFLENYVDLKNLKNDQKYTDQLDYDNLSNLKKDLTSAKSGNPFLKPIAKYADQKIPELTTNIKALKSSMVVKPLRIRGKFENANMQNEYLGLYPKLCSESHCSVNAILDRHFSLDIEKDIVEVVVNSKDTRDDFNYYLCNMAHQLMDAGALLCDILEDNRVNIYLSERYLIQKAVEEKYI
ncbi:hypothetical protein BCT30_02910 [Enterovibrio norvegicus]|uniref:DUF5677 domain-containing protein n=1 Tax=Enterovibrio norvegicus TaxID=188144 RepID=UPI000C844872|nr:DUF5677 domain-containing protein [Enterovibrio norvegicus]PMI32275.1 hypothetical protein BCU47_12855 [Enterovibrio norvegicus]PMI33102.1 hypothetical protein BCU46_03225 [Enterovibrio norvegicus]PMN48348.1 hypothetical protein BCT30_02910 [Enterovibrio norvegicus]